MSRVVVDRGEAEAMFGTDDVEVTGAVLNLPDGAVQNADGSVTLTLEFPIALRSRVAGSDVVHEEQLGELVLHRLNGADMRRILGTKRAMASVALARSSHLTPARMALIAARLDASDLVAANDVVAELGGFVGEDGLPEHATEVDRQITLPLRFPAEPEGFEPRHELVFNRLRGDDLVAIQQARDTLPAALARSTKLSPKEADAVFDTMDAADIMAVNRVIGFLSGSGRKIGR